MDTQTRTQRRSGRAEASSSERFPLSGLLALAMAGFITLLTETLPAGVLPAMARDLDVTISAAGQNVTAYAIGSVIAAFPLMKATAGWPRRRLLLAAIAGFIISNTVTALSSTFVLTLGSRFLAGMVSALIWALLAGYTRRMVAPHRRGRALAIASAGTPVALALGVPAGTFLAQVLDWRISFGLISVLTAVLAVWIRLAIPEFAGQARGERQQLLATLRLPGVLPILATTTAYVLAHSVMYNYIAPFLGPIGLGDRVDALLLTFGAISLLSIWIIGALIDRHLRPLVVASCVLFAVATLALALFAALPMLVFVSAAIWGLASGGVATLLQTAAAEAAGTVVDVVQSLFVTAWNLAIAGGGIVGGILLSTAGSHALPWAALTILIPALVVSIAAHRHGFPGTAGRHAREESV
ncbi:MFS transporter [Streptomyces sp. NPDC002012]|uniref:MFS transporter n=1 Tax=Streptomyces sp. NPDC002012 TaxID=3154532 RepID=UPI0033345853